MISKHFEVIIVGGSYAGLSAALALARSLRQVLVIDSGLPCNRQTPHSHNFLTQDGEKPLLIKEKAKSQIEKYNTVLFRDDLVMIVKKSAAGFEIVTQGGETFTANKVILATGVKDVMPALKGFAECWGISVIHCPYCHGYEFRGRKTGIMANGERAFHLASLVSNLTADVVILTSGTPDFKPEQLAKLQRHPIRIIETDVSEIVHEDSYITKVLFADGRSLELDVIYAAIPLGQPSDLAISLGCELTEQGLVKVDVFQQTTIPGVFACGDNVGLMRSVARAVATGNMAGAAVNGQLTEERF